MSTTQDRISQIEKELSKSLSRRSDIEFFQGTPSKKVGQCWYMRANKASKIYLVTIIEISKSVTLIQYGSGSRELVLTREVEWLELVERRTDPDRRATFDDLKFIGLTNLIEESLLADCQVRRQAKVIYNG